MINKKREQKVLGMAMWYASLALSYQTHHARFIAAGRPQDAATAERLKVHFGLRAMRAMKLLPPTNVRQDRKLDRIGL
ncbi:hypothetical protein A3D70_02790 [Candidatus Adlerbacteria bacterium RIFCSPHIGHO2_02_FULL_54_18]|uniref:Uncharacterized protein n=2 Tax=Candidatus Adleribacteriota TaxID=1752736 RepID=A0A1F4Y3E2_9BACT|nr:MAG: hypothetical protein A2949_00860 [Candidatus Adlerbacteria bacterium RIFCSPLOWO2_01_FULL_54_21b]OGC88384.1 MAG: hypothetical protein A3D70_02790 [Candidatus Adlerbacteria bacterium RIFCSPHIGHO2_02_FULL_54_18]